MYPNRFVQSSLYGALKNDSQGTTLTVTVTAGTVIDPGVTNVIGTATATVGTINAPIRARCHTTRYGNWHVGNMLFSVFDYKFLGIGDPNTYSTNLYCELVRISATQVRLYVSSENTGGGPQLEIQDTQTITFIVSTFLSPFD